MISVKNTAFYLSLCMSVIVLLTITGSVLADDEKLNTDNCEASKWVDSNGNPISIEEKFGPGSMAATRCLDTTKKIKILYQINKECKNAACDKAYAIGNIVNHINDLEITHDINSDDYEIEVVVHSGGWKLILDNNASEKHAMDNPFQMAMEALIARPGVKVRFCQNTANSKGVVFANMIPGIGFVTAGVSAISDLQEAGYRYVQP